METLLAVLPLVLDPLTLGLIVVGTLIGIVFGSIPGLTYSMALVLVLPITFGFDTVPAIGMLLGAYIGGMTGGSVSAILIGIPGTPSAAATVLDGYPLAKNGRAGLALGTAVVVSAFGGLFSLAVMIVSVDFVARMAIRFGPAEIFALVLFGMSTICGLAGKSLLRGMIAGTIGLLLMTIGMDELDGVPRMTFGTTSMLQGVHLLVAMVGLFAVPQVMSVLVNYKSGSQASYRTEAVKTELPSLRQLGSNWSVMIRSALIGTGIGSIPGTGGPVAAFLAYDHARRFSPDKEKFGKGQLSGVVAPETANNAVTGGAMIPLLSLGIPGDPATAIILGGLLIHGLAPGPMLFIEHKVEVYTVYLAIGVAYISVVLIQYFGIRLFVKILRVPPHILAVGILVVCTIGTFAIRNSFLDVYVMTGVGLIGYLLNRFRIPVTPIVLGLVLGGSLEREFRTAMILSEGSLDIFYTSPLVLFFFGLVIAVLTFQLVGERRERAKPKSNVQESAHAES